MERKTWVRRSIGKLEDIRMDYITEPFDSTDADTILELIEKLENTIVDLEGEVESLKEKLDCCEDVDS